MKILVTGTAGFIGFHVCGRLLKEGWEVFGLDNINDYYDQELKYDRLGELGFSEKFKQFHKDVTSEKNERMHFVRCNLEDQEFIDAFFKRHSFDVVCHLAAQAGVRYSLENPKAYMTSNLMGFFNVLEASKANKCSHFVYASSSSVYGKNKEIPFKTSDTVDHPVSLYAATKKSNELIAHTYSHLYGLPTTGLRFFTVYGPWGRPDMAAFLFADAIRQNKPIQVFNHGDMSRDMTYIDDIVEGVFRVINHPPKEKDSYYKVYNIGNHSPVALMEFIAEIEKNLATQAQKNYLPMQMGDVQRTFADVSGLINDLGYKPETSIKEGVKKFMSWYMDRYPMS